MFCMLKKKKYIWLTFQNNSNREKQVILLIILNREKWRWNYLAVKKLSALLRGITSKHHGDFYCLNCFHSLKTKSKLESHKKECETKNMPSDDIKILEFNQYQNSDKAPFIIYTDLECIIQKTDGCKNNPENSSTTKVSKHFTMSTISSFINIENKHVVYRGKDGMNKFC